MLASARRGDAVEYFQTHVVGIPENIVVGMRTAPFRPALDAIAHTLVYETLVIGDGTLTSALAAGVTTPTVVIAGGASPFMREAACALADLLPNGSAHILEGQTHDLDPSVVGPVVEAFVSA